MVCDTATHRYQLDGPAHVRSDPEVDVDITPLTVSHYYLIPRLISVHCKSDLSKLLD